MQTEILKMERTVQKREDFDVVVVGGGIAGICAAVSAARMGVSVLLLEKSINLGGLATSGLISWYEPLCDGKGQQLMHGIAEELIRFAAKCGFDNLPKKWGGSEENKKRNERFSTYFSPTLFSAALDSFVLESGARIRFDTLATYTVMEEGICKGVVVESTNGCEFFGASVVIDATGDASVLHRAGAKTVEGHNYMSYIAHMFTRETAEKLASDGDVCAFRQWVNAGSDMLGNGQPEGMKRITGTDADEVTEFVITGKKRLLAKFSECDKNRFDVMTIPQMPQLRTIRRLVGNQDFCAVDGETFPDAIGNCGDFRPKGIGNHYQIPLGALWNTKFPNMLAAGRIISAPEGDGWEVARVIPVCALTGEAAGKAAAVCVKKNKTLCQLDEKDVQEIAIK